MGHRIQIVERKVGRVILLQPCKGVRLSVFSSPSVETIVSLEIAIACAGICSSVSLDFDLFQTSALLIYFF